MHTFSFVLVLFVTHACAENNVCNNADDYQNIQTSENCWYDPDANSTVPELIKNHGYPLEIYKVTTKDGYVLSIFRIPRGRDSVKKGTQPIYLQHGILSSCSFFVTNGNESLGFMLADAGYDVWLGNARGSTYSRRNLKYSPNDSRFWDFSFHEIATRDIPSTLNLINKVTGRGDIIYVGHSMGTTISYVYSSMFPEHASKRLKLIVAMAPVLFLGAIKTPFKVISNITTPLQKLAIGAGLQEIGANNPKLYKTICLGSRLSYKLCEWLAFTTFGPNSNQTKPEKYPVTFTHFPGGGSLKTVVHFLQEVQSDRFMFYDYGLFKNLAYYNSLYPPNYDLSKVTVPSYIMYSPSDYLSSVENVMKLNKSLGNIVGLYKLKNEKFNHIDYFLGRDVVDVVYNELLGVLSRFKTDS